jgi:ribosomal protein L37AE/L43A
MGEFQSLSLTEKNTKIESGVTSREEFEKILEDLRMLPDTNYFSEDRNKKYLQCDICKRVTLFHKEEGEWRCQNCQK